MIFPLFGIRLFAKFLVQVPTSKSNMGFQDNPGAEEMVEACLDDALPVVVKPDDVRRVLSALKTSAVIVIDELDRLQNREAKILMADTIKTLSDHVVPVTIVLIGVASSVNELIAEHQSIDRALVQIHVPRMSAGELMEIITKGEANTGLSFSVSAKETIVALFEGTYRVTVI